MNMAEPIPIIWRKFEGPWGDAEALGCRNLFYGQRLFLDLFDYQPSSPDEEVKIGDDVIPDSHLIGLTESSRIWRITFDRPFAVRVRDINLNQSKPEGPGISFPCNFTEDSDWLRELDFGKADFIATHYLFATLDDFIEIVGQDRPEVEELPNDLAGEITGQ